MPNWCENRLVVGGKKKDIVSFLHYKEGAGKFLFNNYLPMPQTFLDYDTANPKYTREGFSSDEEYNAYCDGYENALKEQKEKYGVVGWYDWCLKNYGTKWDIFDYDAPFIKELENQLIGLDDDVETEIEMRFCTAWSPCTNFVENTAPLFPTLVFTLSWLETGCYFAGKAVFAIDDCGDLYSEVEEVEPELYEIDGDEPITAEDCRRLEEENGLEDGEGWGVLYEVKNPLDLEL